MSPKDRDELVFTGVALIGFGLVILSWVTFS